MNQKPYRLTLRVDEYTYRRLLSIKDAVNADKKKKITVSELLRRMINGYNMERVGIPKEDVMHGLRDLSGIGNNVNQIAHNTNAGIYSDADREELFRYLTEVSEIRELLLRIIRELF